MTKGILVIAMVAYHSLNYSTNYSLGFRYLPFLPPSFILITGFLIGRLYLRTQVEEAMSLYGRLFLRGMRLFVLFTLLNIGAQLTGRHKFDGDSQGIGYFFDNWMEVYLFGDGRLAAFSILLPIAYLLLLAPLLVTLRRWGRWLVPGAAIALTAATVLGAQLEEAVLNLVLLSAGLLGVALGQCAGDLLEILKRYWLAAVAAYATFVMLPMGTFGQGVLGQLLNACLALASFFGVCAALGDENLIGKRLANLGKYSLLAYIAQIAALQILTRVLGRREPFSEAFFLEMTGVLLVLIVLVEGLQWGRRRARWIDVPYRAIFA